MGEGHSAWPDDAVEVGRVLGAWGVKGAIKVLPFSADPQALFSSRRWFLQAPIPARPGATTALPALLRITAAREQGDTVVASAQEVADRDAAQALKGARVFVARSSFPTAEENSFYWVDLIGLAVVNRECVELGQVVDLIETGPHCVLRVRRAGLGAEPDLEEPERLIPFVSAYVDDVDLGQRRIRVNWGLDY
jgi:16S rRNA processing protein RimM